MERKGVESLKSLGNQNTIYNMDYNPGLLEKNYICSVIEIMEIFMKTVSI